MNIRKKKTFLSMAPVILAVVLGAARLSASDLSFEVAYGHSHNYEQALKGAVPVQGCPGGGFVSVGFSRLVDNRTDSDVYAVRISENGSTVWERTIDIDHLSDDVGTSVRELRYSYGGGFVVTGTTAPAIGSDRDVFLLKLECDGTLAWVQRLRTKSDQAGISTDDVANDLIEAETGGLEPLGSPRQGDLIVAGSSRRHIPKSEALDTDAYLVRTDPLGNVLWSRIYANGGNTVDDPLHHQEWFNAVSEALPVHRQNVGDILAAGAQADTGWEDGLAVRVSGTDGKMTLPLHTMAGFNIPAAGPQERLTELWAIRELRQSGMEHLNIAVAGNIADDGGTTEGYVAKTGPNLNVILADRVIGDGFTGLGTEGFADIQEIVSPTGYGSSGNLVVGGYATSHDSQDVAMLALYAGTLTPVPDTGRLFGDHAGSEERGTALTQAQPWGENLHTGFYINGFTRSKAGAPEDMYLIKTDSFGDTLCSILWSPGDLSGEPGVCEYDPHDENPGTYNELVSSLPDEPSWGRDICK